MVVGVDVVDDESKHGIPDARVRARVRASERTREWG
jgi:hypothetical protein